MRTTTRSPGAAASAGVAARARGPSSATRSLRVCGPRELLSTRSYPAATANRATVPPMFPLPMKPTVVMSLANPGPVIGIPERRWDGGEVRPAVVTDLCDCPELFERVYTHDLRSTT